MEKIDKLNRELLNSKKQLMFINIDNKEYALTKERSLIPVINKKDFLNSFRDDVFYKSVIKNDDIRINEKDLQLYEFYLNKYKDQLTAIKYNDEYYFGCVAVKTDKGFITSLRGKKCLWGYTYVESVNHKKHIINVIQEKASLNAPLLDYLFKNKKVKVIVHLHEFDDSFPSYDYAFPGTVRDSIRSNKTSFNIKYHGVIYLFDQEGNIL